ncbi:MAG: isoleucine--tRNA ligase [Nocardioidaceae bacterium]
MTTTSHRSRGYRPVAAHVDLPEMERAILALWAERGTFAASLARSAELPAWTFYEGPPTANGRPGVHHVEARVFKDLFPRFKTMQGHRVDRKAGWDCQGLHVEVGVEKELGLSGKRQIEEYGVAEFNARCRASVERHVDAFEQMTERMGYWVDMFAPYRTMDATYIDSVWWSLKQVFDKGLLVEDQRISPYCPRCETGLSDHELGQPGAYETVADPSVYVRLPLTTGPLAGRAALLVWTTTPWTLVSNTAVAVHPAVDYVVATNGSESLVVAEALLEPALGAGWEVEQRLRGADLEHWHYQRPFGLVDFPAAAHYVVLADYVTTDDGTGLVHQSPAFGADDLLVAKAYNLPVVNPVLADGHFADDVPLVGGQFFKHADADLIDDLDNRGLLLRHQTYEHSYPHCWRCHTPLMYYAMPSWYVRTTVVKDALLRENEGTTWYPERIKWGRYGDWLHHNVDWSLSRTRYWGTPLPIWRCAAGHLTCVGSRAELAELSGTMLDDPHRPFVDEVSFGCPRCAEPASRVPEVIDAWYDSGSMPFAQWGYPYLDGSRQEFERAYPAQFICEAEDQTRGWFYSLMAIGTLLFDRSAYQNVVCVGLILAEDGRKMSKHLGNILEPMPLMEQHGADALRWFMGCSGSPWAARRVGHAGLQEIVRKVLLTYWNTVAFQVLYACTAGWAPDRDPAPAVADRPVLDRWALSEAHRLVREVTAALESYDTQRAGALLAAFIGDLSNWYVRRSRRRFWEGDGAAFSTLHECLRLLTLLLAPITPFVTERVWQDVFWTTSDSSVDSVHLATWPRADASRIDDGLDIGVRQARRVVELGRSARAEAKVRTRQPLQRLLVGSGAWAALGEELRSEVASELNVGSVDSLGAAGADLVEHTAKANFRTLGSRFGQRTPAVAAAISAADAAALAAALADTGTTEVLVDGESLTVQADEVIVSERPRSGWSVVNDQGETVALDLELTPELVRAGLAREMVRLVQEARKASGFEVSDRIDLWWQAHGRNAEELRRALAEHAGLLAREVLARSVAAGPPDGAAGSSYTDENLGLTVWLNRS